MDQIQIEAALNALTKENADMKERVRILENQLSNARVLIKNFEGAFKIFGATPTTDDAQEGSVYLVNNGGTYSLSARINNGWRSVTLT